MLNVDAVVKKKTKKKAKCKIISKSNQNKKIIN